MKQFLLNLPKRFAFHQLISTVTVLQAVQTNLSVVPNTSGTLVAQLNDISDQGFHYTQITGSQQPTIVPAGLNGHTFITFDGSDDEMVSTLALPVPGTTPTWIWMIFRQNAWTNNDIILGNNAANANMQIRQTGTTPALVQQNVTQVNSNTGAPINQWVRGEFYFSNSTSDYVKLGSTTTTGAAAGNVSTVGRVLANRAAGTARAGFSLFAMIHTRGLPSVQERAALDLAVQRLFDGQVTT